MEYDDSSRYYQTPNKGQFHGRKARKVTAMENSPAKLAVVVPADHHQYHGRSSHNLQDKRNPNNGTNVPKTTRKQQHRNNFTPTVIPGGHENLTYYMASNILSPVSQYTNRDRYKTRVNIDPSETATATTTTAVHCRSLEQKAKAVGTGHEVHEEQTIFDEDSGTVETHNRILEAGQIEDEVYEFQEWNQHDPEAVKQGYEGGNTKYDHRDDGLTGVEIGEPVQKDSSSMAQMLSPLTNCSGIYTTKKTRDHRDYGDNDQYQSKYGERNYQKVNAPTHSPKSPRKAVNMLKSDLNRIRKQYNVETPHSSSIYTGFAAENDKKKKAYSGNVVRYNERRSMVNTQSEENRKEVPTLKSQKVKETDHALLNRVLEYDPNGSPNVNSSVTNPKGVASAFKHHHSNPVNNTMTSSMIPIDESTNVHLPHESVYPTAMGSPLLIHPPQPVAHVKMSKYNEDDDEVITKDTIGKKSVASLVSCLFLANKDNKALCPSKQMIQQIMQKTHYHMSSLINSGVFNSNSVEVIDFERLIDLTQKLVLYSDNLKGQVEDLHDALDPHRLEEEEKERLQTQEELMKTNNQVVDLVKEIKHMRHKNSILQQEIAKMKKEHQGGNETSTPRKNSGLPSPKFSNIATPTSNSKSLQLSDDVDELKESLKELTESKKRMTEQFESKLKESHETISSLEKALNAQVSYQSKLKGQIKEKEDQLETMRKKVEILGVDDEMVSSKNDGKTEKILELEQALESLQNENKELSEKIEDLQSEDDVRSDLADRVLDLQLELKNKSDELGNLKRVNEEISLAREMATSVKGMLESDVTVLREKLNASETKIRELQNELEERVKLDQDTDEKTSTKQREIDMLTDKINDYKNTLEQSKEAAARDQSMLKSKVDDLENKCRTSTKQISTLEDELTNARREYEKELSDMQKQTSFEVMRLKMKVDIDAQSLKQRDAESKTLKETLRQTLAKRNELEHTIKLVKNDISMKDTEISNLQRSNEEYESIISQKQDLELKIENLEKECAQERRKCGQIPQLTQLIGDYEALIDNLKSEKAKQDTLLNELKREISQHESEKQVLEKQVEIFNETLHKTKQQAQEISEIKSQLVSKELLIQNLEKDRTAQKDVYSKNVKSFEREMEKLEDEKKNVILYLNEQLRETEQSKAKVRSDTSKIEAQKELIERLSKEIESSRRKTLELENAVDKYKQELSHLSLSNDKRAHSDSEKISTLQRKLKDQNDLLTRTQKQLNREMTVTSHHLPELQAKLKDTQSKLKGYEKIDKLGAQSNQNHYSRLEEKLHLVTQEKIQAEVENQKRARELELLGNEIEQMKKTSSSSSNPQKADVVNDGRFSHSDVRGSSFSSNASTALDSETVSSCGSSSSSSLLKYSSRKDFGGSLNSSSFGGYSVPTTDSASSSFMSSSSSLFSHRMKKKPLSLNDDLDEHIRRVLAESDQTTSTTSTSTAKNTYGGGIYGASSSSSTLDRVKKLLHDSDNQSLLSDR